MKVGEYCRTKKDGIGKIISFSYQEDDVCCFIELSNRRTGIKQFNIIKSSPNIIDLIEEGDILSFKDGSICRILEKSDNYYLLKDYGGEQYYESKEWLSSFKSIITHEQIESMEYKVKE